VSAVALVAGRTHGHIAKRAQIQQEQEQLRNEAAAAPSADDEEWCHTQLLDLLIAWDAADDGQRSRLLAGLFESVEAEALRAGRSRSPPSREAHGSTFFK
jgi:hypothetical protein